MIEEGGPFDLQRAEQDKEIDELTRNLNLSNERLSLFKQLVADYGREPTNCVFGSIDSLFKLEDHFRKAGIDPDLVVGALDADEPSVDALSLRLLELLIAREALPKDGPKHIENRRNAISDTTINYLISQVLEAFDWQDETFHVPASLVVLIRHQLCKSKPDLYEEYLSRERRDRAASKLAQTLQPNERVSIRKVERLGIPHSTAQRWFADKKFKRRVETERKWVSEGLFKKGD
jgi:hypothetical protein